MNNNGAAFIGLGLLLLGLAAGFYIGQHTHCIEFFGTKCAFVK